MERHYSIKHGRCRVALSVRWRGKVQPWANDANLQLILLADTPCTAFGTHPDIHPHQRANQQTTHQCNQHHNR